MTLIHFLCDEAFCWGPATARKGGKRGGEKNRKEGRERAGERQTKKVLGDGGVNVHIYTYIHARRHISP